MKPQVYIVLEETETSVHIIRVYANYEDAKEKAERMERNKLLDGVRYRVNSYDLL